MDRLTAAACYLPVPGLAWLLARARPQDRLVRFHARQGGWLAVGAWALLVAAGFLPARSPMLPIAAGLVLALAATGILVGAASAARGHFARLRGLSDALVMAQRREDAAGRRNSA